LRYVGLGSNPRGLEIQSVCAVGEWHFDFDIVEFIFLRKIQKGVFLWVAKRKERRKVSNA
jgi:hypothetical protein